MYDLPDLPRPLVRRDNPVRQDSSVAGILLVGLVAIAWCATSANAQTSQKSFVVTEGRVADLEYSSFQAYVGTVALPADGIWSLTALKTSASAREFYLSPPTGTTINQLGNRMFAAFQQEQIDRDRWDLRVVYESCRKFAQDHNGRGPKSLSDMNQDERQRRMIVRWKNRNWRQPQLASLVDDQDDGPVAFLVPEANFRFSELNELLQQDDNNANRQVRRTVSTQDRVVLAFE